MEKIERFFHLRPEKYSSVLNGFIGGVTTKGGATVRVYGDEHRVTVQTAFCSANDAFCRKTGRDVAAKHVASELPTELLPLYLADMSRQVTKLVLRLSNTKRREHPLWNTDYSFATKYFAKKQALATTE